MMKRYFSVLLTFLFLFAMSWAVYAFYHRYMRPMRIAIVADFDSSWLSYREAAQGTNFAIHRYKNEDIATVPFENYDLVMLNGMGWLPNEEQLKNVQKAADLGTYVHVSAATRESTNKLNNLPENVAAEFAKYTQAGGKENLHNALKYLARELKGYQAVIPEPKQRPRNGYFHLDGKLYENIEDYDAYFDTCYPGLSENAPRIVLTGAFVNLYDDLERGAVDMIGEKLVASGCRVYAVMGGMSPSGSSLKSMIDACKPDALIFFPMGRLLPNNEAIPYLKKRNIPCFDAINIVQSKDEWLNESTAMSGGYTSQTIVMPELDGIIEPTAVAAVDTNEEGIALRLPLPERIDMLVRRINRWMTLKRKPNADKKVAIVYFKAPGHSPLGAAGIETIDSLYNVLCRMKDDGYDLSDRFPESASELEKMIQDEAPLLGGWAKGAWEEYLNNRNPEFVSAKDYTLWLRKDLPQQNLKSLIDVWGSAPGKQSTVQKDNQPCLVIPRVRLGNIVLLPQPGTAVVSDDATSAKMSTVPGGDTMTQAGPPGSSAGKASSNNIKVTQSGVETDEMSAVHGTDQPPPHNYVGAYLWIRHGFKADAMIHFGTHGSLEFTKGKSMALSDFCWPTILTGDLPHIYPYIVDNIDEGMIAKRRSSAVLVTHMTPPFTKAEIYGDLQALADKVRDFKMVEGDTLRHEYLVSITDAVRKNDLFKEIGYRENPAGDVLLTPKDIDTLDEYIEHLSDENITEGLHVIGRSWEEHQITDTVIAMLGDKAPLWIEEVRKSNRIKNLPDGTADALKFFVTEVLHGRIVAEKGETDKDETKTKPQHPGTMPPHGAGPPGSMPPSMSTGHAGAMPPHGGGHPGGMTSSMGTGHPGGMPPSMGGGMGRGSMTRAPSQWGDVTGAPKKTDDSDDPYTALVESITLHAKNLKNCTPGELDGIMTALSGGYVEASTGGDVIVNPAVAPTGRNMGSINLDQTPTEESYRVGVQLTEQILADYRAENQGRYPRRVACTLWGGEYNRTRGVLLAQCLYLMGLKPKWDSRRVVSEVELIPSEELGRPRIDVLAQTSGHFRDSGTSRIELLDKAVRLVAKLPDEKYPNFVKENSHLTEDQLKRQGLAPSDAREYSTARIFGSPNNNSYATGAQGAVDSAESGDAANIADRYIQGMSGMYRNGKVWGVAVEGLLESQLQGTDLMIQSRSANTWGPLTLDHVYEFSTLALAIREKTGNDPGMWFSDMRNPTKPRAMTATQAIREEARASLWNPKYIAALQKEGAGAAANMVEPMRNLRGWNVVQPASIDQTLWDEMNSVYIDDKHGLEMKQYFEQKNPYALQDMTAVMLDVIRKGMWKPDEKVVRNLAELHVEMVEKYGAGCSADTCGDAKLHAFLGEVLNGVPIEYEAALKLVLESRGEPFPEVEGMHLEEKIDLLKNANAPLMVSAPTFVVLIIGGMMFILCFGFFSGISKILPLR